MADVAPLQGQGFNEGKTKPFTAEDFRFTPKGDTLYAIVMAAPQGPVRIKSLVTAARLLSAPIASVELLGGTTPVRWSQSAEALEIEPPAALPSSIAVVFRIAVRR